MGCWSCFNPIKRLCICVRGIDFGSFYDFDMVFNNHFQQYFSYIVVVSFIGGGIRRKPPTCRKSLTNIYHIIHRIHLSGIRTHNVIGDRKPPRACAKYDHHTILYIFRSKYRKKFFQNILPSLL